MGLKNILNKKISVLLFLMSSLLFLATIFYACNVTEEEIVETTTLHTPVAKNLYMFEKETEETTAESRQDRKFDDIKTPSPTTIKIEENQFLTQIDNIKRKISEYENKIIDIEGMYGKFSSWDNSFNGDIIFRNGPNEYNNDIWGGFFLNDLKGLELEIDDWIHVTGKPYIYKTTDTEGTEYTYLFLDVLSIEKGIDKKRGSEFVVN